MPTHKRRHVLVEHTRAGVWVVRFVRADLRDQLRDDADGNACPLFAELCGRVLAGLREGQTVVLNLGLVEYFPTALYRCLLKVSDFVAGRRAHLILCRLSPEHEEMFRLLKAYRVFRVTTTEGRAVHDAAAHAKCPANGQKQ